MKRNEGLTLSLDSQIGSEWRKNRKKAIDIRLVTSQTEYWTRERDASPDRQ